MQANDRDVKRAEHAAYGVSLGRLFVLGANAGVSAAGPIARSKGWNPSVFAVPESFVLMIFARLRREASWVETGPLSMKNG
ncbi:hypothetical protein [Paracandidimonas soli]|uniref:hypothetical protein n=1 Tax=Paracandidimonas soli TaxID=1917182 RepID=UPI00104BCD60|nr:hypothetical protein [Paracandidimonas soli]